MTESVSFHMLPAGDGDCLLVQSLDPAGVATTSVLVDGGRKETYANWKPILQKLIGSQGVIDLVVVTHIDSDHIGGILAMLDDDDRDFSIGGIWFNGYPQVVAARALDQNCEVYGVTQADELSQLVENLALPWNNIFEGGPIHSGTKVANCRAGEFAITIVTPSQSKLALMHGIWTSTYEAATRQDEPSSVGRVEKYGNRATDIQELAKAADENDTAKPNGSSIGLILEAFGRRLLLTGDCHAADLTAGLAVLAGPTASQISVDVLKISHHGARKNTTSALLKMVKASTYAFSTDGSRHEHPDDQTVAKVIVSGGGTKILAFNYRTDRTGRWDDLRLKEEFGYETRYAAEKEEGYLCIKLPGA